MLIICCLLFIVHYLLLILLFNNKKNRIAKMKKALYILCAVVCILLAVFFYFKMAGKSSEKTSRFDIPEEAKNIIAEKYIAIMADNGMTINEGKNPPDIQGIFATDSLELFYTSLKNDLAIGYKVPSYRYKFYGQDGIQVKTDYIQEAPSSDDNATGKGTALSGSGNKFTAYIEQKGSAKGATYRQATVLSGEITPQGIKDFQWGFCILEKEDPDNKLMQVGGVRIWKDKGKLAKKKTKFPYGD
jgi:hypothetical protein